MTKTKMIQTIRNASPEYISIQAAECILEAVESAGMLPPNRGVTIYIPNDPSNFESIERYMSLHNWETE